MSVLGLPDWFGKPLAVFLIDILLAGDNALVIALVCMTLPPRGRRTVLLVGTLGAVVLRVVLAGVAATLLAVPGLKLTGAVVLFVLALGLARPDQGKGKQTPSLNGRHGVWAAALLVTLVDVLMSLDNVLALAAVAGDSWFYLSLGLLLSVSLVMFGSVLVVELLDRVPSLTRLGAALLGWVAGQMAVSDALLQDWIAQQAPALPLLVPALAAIYAYSVGHTAPPAVRRTAIAPPRPAPLPRPKPAPSLAIDPPDAPAHSAAQDRRLLIVFVALFVVVGVFLAFLAMRAGGPAG